MNYRKQGFFISKQCSIERLFEKPLTYTRKSNGSRIKPLEAPALTLTQEDTCLFNTPVCFRLYTKSCEICKLQDMPFCSNLNATPPCQTSSKAFETSKKSPKTSQPQSKDL